MEIGQTIAAVFGLLQQVVVAAGALRDLHNETRAEVREYLLDNSNCLASLAQKRREGLPTDKECEELSVYIARVPTALKRLLGDDFEATLTDSLDQVVASPASLTIFADDPKIAPEAIEGLSGRLLGEANRLR